MTLPEMKSRVLAVLADGPLSEADVVKRVNAAVRGELPGERVVTRHVAGVLGKLAAERSVIRDDQNRYGLAH